MSKSRESKSTVSETLPKICDGGLERTGAFFGEIIPRRVGVRISRELMSVIYDCWALLVDIFHGVIFEGLEIF